MKLVSDEEPVRLIATFSREALHLEMRDVYAVKDEAERFARFLEKGYRDHDAEAEERLPWMKIIQHATAAGKVLRRARIISEPVTDYIRYEWEGTGSNVEAGEKIKWLPRRLASAIALPGNDFWLFDESTVVFTVFTGVGDVCERQLTTDPAVVQLCKSAFEAIWSIAIPHGEYKPS
ncbi:MAG: DUF6879 family protein [Gammaproteobacteria bacterium]